MSGPIHICTFKTILGPLSKLFEFRLAFLCFFAFVYYLREQATYTVTVLGRNILDSTVNGVFV
jgi:hypothetical protein